MSLFVDLDGVLSDFDAAFERLFGKKISEWPHSISNDPYVWDRVHKSQVFWLDMPVMRDAYDLWEFCKPHDPIILTATPTNEHHESVAEQKRTWCRINLRTSKVICSYSNRKHKYAAPGDILIDDRPHQKPSWCDAGGIWITHTSAADSIAQLKALGYR